MNWETWHSATRCLVSTLSTPSWERTPDQTTRTREYTHNTDTRLKNGFCFSPLPVVSLSLSPRSEPGRHEDWACQCRLCCISRSIWQQTQIFLWLNMNKICSKLCTLTASFVKSENWSSGLEEQRPRLIGDQVMRPIPILLYSSAMYSSTYSRNRANIEKSSKINIILFSPPFLCGTGDTPRTHTVAQCSGGCEPLSKSRISPPESISQFPST